MAMKKGKVHLWMTGSLGLGAIVVILAVIFHFSILPAIINSNLKSEAVLAGSSPLYKKWKSPATNSLKVYFFNVTNPDEVTAGEMPVLKEVGPYVYDLIEPKEILSVDEELDTVLYRESHISTFNATESEPLKETDLVTILDFALLGAILAAESFAPDQMDRIKTVIEQVFPNRSSPFITATVAEHLFEGVTMDCSSRSYLIYMLCRQLIIRAPSMFWMDENRVFKFAFLHEKNITSPDLFTAYRGIGKIQQRGLLHSFQNLTVMNAWPTPYCNMLNGSSDGHFHPVALTPKDTVYVFNPTLSRSFALTFKEYVEIGGVQVMRYEVGNATLGSGEDFPANECFCPRGLPEGENATVPLYCPPHGILNIATITKAPILTSWPWFAYADKKIYNEAFTHPSPHAQQDLVSVAYIEPITGLAVKGSVRLQLNLELKPMPAFSYLEKVTRRIHPALWYEVNFQIGSRELAWLSSILGKLRGYQVILYIGIGFGAVMLIIAAILYLIHKDICPFNASKVSSASDDRPEKIVPVAMVLQRKGVQMEPTGTPIASIHSPYALYQQHFM